MEHLFSTTKTNPKLPFCRAVPAILMTVSILAVGLVLSVTADAVPPRSTGFSVQSAERDGASRFAPVAAGNVDGNLQPVAGQEGTIHLRPFDRPPVDAHKLLGDVDRDLVYTPLAPCRLFDTRGHSSAMGAVGQIFLPNSRRNIVPSGRCDIPTNGVKNLFISFTIWNNTSNSGGYITFLAPSAPVRTLNHVFEFGNAWNASSTLVPTGPAGEFEVYVAAAKAEVVVDVLGYFASPQATALDCVSVDGAPVQIPAAATVDADATCSAGYSITGGGCTSTTTGGLETLSRIVDATSSFRCSAKNVTAGPLDLTPQARCCRVPGR